MVVEVVEVVDDVVEVVEVVDVLVVDDVEGGGVIGVGSSMPMISVITDAFGASAPAVGDWVITRPMFGLPCGTTANVMLRLNPAAWI